MKLSDAGEFALIDLIHNIVTRARDPQAPSWQRTVIEIGDDAAAWLGDNRIQLATTDTLVEDTHFDLRLTSWEELGWKALAINLSDIAAMGGIPRYALLSLSLPAHLETEAISKFVQEMMRLAGEFGVALIGGNLASAPKVVITMTVIGCSKGKKLLRRSAACPGDQIAVTGYLGTSAAGLEVLRGRRISDAEAINMLKQAHLKPMPRVREAQTLVEQGVRAAIDVSDGLIADLDHVCECSKVNARVNVEQVPIHPAVRANFPDHRELALCGGEDYELLFAADAATITRARQKLNCPITVIGEITDHALPTRVTLIDNQGNTIPYRKGGWEHFKNAMPETEVA